MFFDAGQEKKRPKASGSSIKYDTPKSAPKEGETGTLITTVVQINIGDGTSSISPRYAPEPVPPRKKSITKPTEKPPEPVNQTGTLPKYENTPIRSKKNYQHHELKPRPDPAKESPYDYPARTPPVLTPKMNRHLGVEGNYLYYTFLITSQF